ncbi:MAG: STAS domain-containing protein [Ignavibacteriales bacterium]
MFRTTEISEDEKTVTLRLDGKLVHAWVSNLEMLCLHYKDEKNKTVVLDFSGVNFIDNEGLRMLENIKDEKVKIINCSLFIQKLLHKLLINNKD